MIKKLLTYWETCLADESRMETSDTDAHVIFSESSVTATGIMDATRAARLRELHVAATRSNKKGPTPKAPTLPARVPSDEDPIPVLIRTYALHPIHSHGMRPYSQRRPRCYFPMHIPAVLHSDNRLTRDETHITPWIGREYLSPTSYSEEQEVLPIVGSISDYDAFITAHPVPSTDWEEYLEWCGALWRTVTRGTIPEGFQEIDETRIFAASTSNPTTKSISQLYEALKAPTYSPNKLLSTLATIPRHTPPSVVDCALRLTQLDAPRGHMTAHHGLAPSQRDAVVAATRLAHGDVLAVNGPPGTGKTTLLQSIIAHEVVQAALGGGEPAIIFGASANNQAVQNIIKAMDDVIKENVHVASTRKDHPNSAWMIRWIDDAPSFGLFLPASSMEMDGRCCYAKYSTSPSPNGKPQARRQWEGFPTRERDLHYIAQAEHLWLDRFYNAYRLHAESLHSGITSVWHNLHAIHRQLSSISDSVRQWRKQESWWHAFTEGRDITPGERIQEVQAEQSTAEQAAANKLTAARTEHASLLAHWDQTIANQTHAYQACVTTLDRANARFDQTSILCQQVDAASLPHGLLEHIASCTPLFQRYASTRQHTRRLATLSTPEAKDLFRAVMHTRDPARWTDAATKAQADCQAHLESAKANVTRSLTLLNDLRTRSNAQIKAAGASILLTEQQLQTLKATNEATLHTLHQNIDSLHALRASVRARFSALHDEAKSFDPTIPIMELNAHPNADLWLASIDQLLDITLRHELLQKSMRYWEGRWILEAKALTPRDWNNNSDHACIKRFRRWAMLTPCLISTLYTLPKHLLYYDGTDGTQRHLFDSIDLLILDESGQIAPHVGAHVLALARKAVVVGDTHQLEHTCKITRGIDRANCIKSGLAEHWANRFPSIPHILSESADDAKGSVMRIAQACTRFFSADSSQESGMFLSEHRRCDTNIISFCNDLVYQGRLVPLTKQTPKAPRMRAWNWAHVRGEVTPCGGSKVNKPEAHAIADWITKRAPEWLAHYTTLRKSPSHPITLRSVVAVVTPFKQQAEEIKRALAQQGPDYVDIIVGTVDALQGAECPIVIFSPTYTFSSRSGQRMFMIDSKNNRLNVAVSRAKDSFVVIGDMRLFRKGALLPSEILANYLYADEGNEVPDCSGNLNPDLDSFLKRHTSLEGLRITTLEEHRNALTSAIRNLTPGERLIVVSPFISQRAIEYDGIPLLCKDATARGGSIHIIIDREERFDTSGRNTLVAIKALEDAGALVQQLPAIHNKTLIVGEREIIEGSFNWLSAVRDPSRLGVRYETSWRISGTNARKIVTSAIKELQELGMRTN